MRDWDCWLMNEDECCGFGDGWKKVFVWGEKVGFVLVLWGMCVYVCID